MSKARRARLLVIDVDGTLLTTDYRLTAVTRRSVQQVSDKGVQVVLASARSPRALHPIMEELSITGLPFAILERSPVGSFLTRMRQAKQ